MLIINPYCMDKPYNNEEEILSLQVCMVKGANPQPTGQELVIFYHLQLNCKYQFRTKGCCHALALYHL